MRQRVLDLMAEDGRGIVTFSDLRRLGVGPAVLRTLLREGAIVRLFRGAYVSAAQWYPDCEQVEQLGRAVLEERRHLLLLDAVLRSYGAKVGASHQTAVLAWGLPVLWPTLDRVHVSHTRQGATGRRHDAFTIHRCDLDEAFTRHEGRLVTVPALAVLGTAALCGLKAGLVAMDGALHERRTSPEELEEWLDRLRHHPGLSTARAVVELADGRAESAGESLLRLLLVRLGISFVPQHWIRTADGRYHRVDFYLPSLGVVLEFDGLKKYENRSDSTSDGQRASRSRNGDNPLADEKMREDALRADGYGVGRVVWSGLDAESVAAVITTAARQAQPRARERASTPPPWAAPEAVRD